MNPEKKNLECLLCKKTIKFIDKKPHNLDGTPHTHTKAEWKEYYKNLEEQENLPKKTSKIVENEEISSKKPEINNNLPFQAFSIQLEQKLLTENPKLTDFERGFLAALIYEKKRG